MRKTTVLALGGNAICGKSHKEEEQNILKTLNGIEELIRAGPLVITHGNGPQVGRLVDQTSLPLWLCSAQTQGETGTLILQNLERYLYKHKITKSITVIQTHVLVDHHDISLRKPTKPIGNFLTKKKAEKLKKIGCKIKKDLVKKGFWRRIVPSPKPIKIIELEAIKLLLEKDHIVIAGGGGGVPVYKSGDGLIPVEAIIDKDYTSSLIASGVEAERLVLLTNIKTVKLNFGKENEKSLRKLSVTDAKKFLSKKHFKTGMESKIRAIIDFLKRGGTEATIGHIFQLQKIIKGKTGTIIKKTN